MNINRDKILEEVNQLFSKYPDTHPLLICVSGSHAYGLNTERSDVDVRGIFICGQDRVLSDLNYNGDYKYIKQISDDKNDTKIVILKKRGMIKQTK